MKNFSLLFACILSVSITMGRTNVECINFESTNVYNKLIIDTLTNPDNIWQIGSPQKNIFTAAYSSPNVIVTDTLNPYPVNDTSSFIIMHEVYVPAAMLGTRVSGRYWVNTDTLSDYGKIDVSTDNGNSWVDILSGDPLINTSIGCYNPPSLTGNSGTWNEFTFNLYNLFQYNGDTVLIRFTFISDGIQTNKDGIMFDDIWIEDGTEGVSDFGNSGFGLEVFPNPASTRISITAPSKSQIEIFNIEGQCMMKTISENNTTNLDISGFAPGMYFVKVNNCTSKFIKQ
ncbi:MAG: T9SS type A sorting domain-containing protein [Bacteroidota bacterium]